MKCLNFLIAFFIFITHTVAQQNHFIYIQTENKQPFYVRVGDKLLSSSSVGYIVIPKLQNGIYEMNIGFPKNEWPQQRITVTVNNNDAGFVLKNFEEKGWGLFNMQTLDIIMASAGQANKDGAAKNQSDGFADVLADVVNTPSIKQKPAAEKTSETKALSENPKPVPVTETRITPVVKEEKPATTVLKPPVKLLSTLDNTGRSIIYADAYNGNTDTIRIFIPYNGKAEEPIKGTATTTIEKPAIQELKTVEKEQAPVVKEKKEEPKEDKKFLDIEVQNPNTKKEPVVNEPVKEKKEPEATTNTNTVVTMINSDCKAVANDDDFLKLRKKMAAQKTDDNMIVMARKAFATKCYTTEQVSNLSVLFLKDEGRYNFFDAAYPHVNDSRNFGSLVSKLTDEYYINRFKAMMRH